MVHRPISATLIFALASISSTTSAASPDAASASKDLELVLTVPVETTLGAHGLRAPKEVWPELIDSAKRTIDLAELYVATKPDSALSPVVAALERAGKRGVRIRMLLEKKMEGTYARELAPIRAIPNLDLQIFDLGRMSPEGVLHAKYMLIDGERGYVGSQNFDWRSLEHIHELGVRVSAPKIVGDLAAIFEHDWRANALVQAGRPVPPLHAEGEPRPRLAKDDEGAYLVASPFAFDPPGIGDSEAELVRLIGSAKEELAVELLDYCPLDYPKKRYYAPIDVALREAAARGVRVKLLVSHWNTEQPCLQHLKSLDLVPRIEVRIVTLPEAKAGFIPFARVIHAKYMVVDGALLWVGTSNWAGGYLDRSRNLELVIRDPALAATALDIHRELWSTPYAEPLKACKRYPRPKKK